MPVKEAEAAKVLESARRTLRIESEAVGALAERLDERFLEAVEILQECRGRVVLMGMGKSGLVARKIAATLASTGTPALFLHPAEGGHGDLGMLVRGDVAVVVSNSGKTDEIVDLLPTIKRLGVPLVGLVGNLHSTLAKECDICLDVGVREEACPLGLAPTASTTAALAMGDALAVALFERRGFRPEDFAVFHPAGILGRRLLKVSDLMHVGDDLPVVPEEASMQAAILEISGKRLGMTAVVDAAGKLVGVITDGDLRRGLQRSGEQLLSLPVRACMTRRPKTIDRDDLAAKAVEVMERHSITSLLIVRSDGRPEGVIHLHDLLKAGVV